jgi:hypothetical protein
LLQIPNAENQGHNFQAFWRSTTSSMIIRLIVCPVEI